MDKLYNTQQELVQEISVEHTRKILGGNIGIVFYDSQYEGFTIIPVVEDFVTRFHLKDFGICFIACKVYKELERIMKLMKFPFSVDKAQEGHSLKRDSAVTSF